MLTKELVKKLRRVSISKDNDKSRERLSDAFKSSDNTTKREIIELSGLTNRAFYNAFASGSATAKIVLSTAQVANVSPYYLIGKSDKQGKCTKKVLEEFLLEHGYQELVEEMNAQKEPKNPISEEDVCIVEQTGNPAHAADEVAEQSDDNGEHQEEQETQTDTAQEKPTEQAEDASEGKLSDWDDWDDDDWDDYGDIYDDDEESTFTVKLNNTNKMDIAIETLEEDTAIFLFRALSKRAEAGGASARLFELVKRCLLS